MKKLTRERLELYPFSFVAVTALGAVAASTFHMITAYSWANLAWMGWILAVVTVLQNSALVALSTLNQDIIRRAVIAGLILLCIIEFWGNFWAGGLLAMQYLPSDLNHLFFNVDRDTLVVVATILFSAILPLLNLIIIFAVSEAAKRLVERTGQAQPVNQWAEMVMRMRETEQAASATKSQPNQ